MSKILVFIEQNNGELNKASLCALKAANELKSAWNLNSLVAITLGKNSSSAAEKISGCGFEKIYYSESESLEKYLPETYSKATIEIFKKEDCTSLVLACTSTGKDFSGRVSANLDAGQASDITAVNSDGSLQRPIYAGNALADVQILTDKKVVTVRTSAFDAESASTGSSSVESFDFSIEDPLGEIISYDKPESSRPELSDADVVVSGGRALESSENFEKYIYPLADTLGAAVGASRAAVDSGYAPNDWQVGQTGKIVAPNLYIAIGISGAIQHLAGMKDSKTIVAINKDAEAPIFEIADYGLVADLYEVVEPLNEAIKKAKN